MPFVRVTSIVLLALAVGLAGCTTGPASLPLNDDDGQDEGPARASAAGGPVELALHLEDARAFYANGTRVTLNVSVGWDVDALEAGVVLPNGVSLVTGNLDYAGAGRVDAPVTLTGIVRAADAGEFVLRAWAEAGMPAGSRAAPSALLGVRGNASTASTFTPDAPVHAFDVTLTPDAGNATLVLVALTGPADTAARFHVVAAEGVTLEEGVSPWDVTLTGDSPVTGEYALRFPGDGTFVVTGALAPDPRVDGGLYTEELWFTVEGDHVSVSATEPDRDDTHEGETPSSDTGSGEGSDGNATSTPP